eukprot:1190346-Prorocentrum_minimum.AAC.1
MLRCSEEKGRALLGCYGCQAVVVPAAFRCALRLRGTVLGVPPLAPLPPFGGCRPGPGRVQPHGPFQHHQRLLPRHHPRRRRPRHAHGHARRRRGRGGVRRDGDPRGARQAGGRHELHRAGSDGDIWRAGGDEGGRRGHLHAAGHRAAGGQRGRGTEAAADLGGTQFSNMRSSVEERHPSGCVLKSTFFGRHDPPEEAG